jgi:hypothetical protein
MLDPELSRQKNGEIRIAEEKAVPVIARLPVRASVIRSDLPNIA